MTTVKDTSIRALVVEDEADYADLLASWLREDGYAVETAADGVEALDHVRTRRPDVITLDMQMPRKGGVEFYRQLRSDTEFRDIPIIVVTGLTVDDRDIETFMRTFLDVSHLPMPDAYLEKPVDGDELRRVVRESLRVNAAPA